MDILLLIVTIVVIIAFSTVLSKLSLLQMKTSIYLTFVVCFGGVNLMVLKDMFSYKTENDLILHIALYLICTICIFNILDRFD